MQDATHHDEVRLTMSRATHLRVSHDSLWVACKSLWVQWLTLCCATHYESCYLLWIVPLIMSNSLWPCATHYKLSDSLWVMQLTVSFWTHYELCDSLWVIWLLYNELCKSLWRCATHCDNVWLIISLASLTMSLKRLTMSSVSHSEWCKTHSELRDSLWVAWLTMSCMTHY